MQSVSLLSADDIVGLSSSSANRLTERLINDQTADGLTNQQDTKHRDRWANGWPCDKTRDLSSWWLPGCSWTATRCVASPRRSAHNVSAASFWREPTAFKSQTHRDSRRKRKSEPSIASSSTTNSDISKPLFHCSALLKRTNQFSPLEMRS